MRNITTLIALIALSTLAQAHPLPAKAVLDTSVAFESADAAAAAGESAAWHASTTKEFAGIIVMTEGKYYISIPVSSGEKGHFSLTILLTPSQHFVALYHTHPYSEKQDGMDSMKFSRDDVDVAKALKVNSYIGVAYDHTLRLFVPGQTHVSRGESDGDVIGKF